MVVAHKKEVLGRGQAARSTRALARQCASGTDEKIGKKKEMPAPAGHEGPAAAQAWAALPASLKRLCAPAGRGNAADATYL
jgi:hypothetical protein